jgi:hypothetical protein
MQTESLNTKKIIIGIVVFVLIALAVWFLFFRDSTPVVTLDEFGNPVQVEVVGQDLINLLAQLQAVTLDSSVFKSAGFVNLTDFSVNLGSQPQGRENPFASTRGIAPVSTVKK